MKGVTVPELFKGGRPFAGLRENTLVLLPKCAVGIDHLSRSGIVDARENTAPNDLGGFVVFRGIEMGSLSARHAFKLEHCGSQELVFVAESVDALAVLADRQGVDDRGMRTGLDGGEERLEESSQLVPAVHVLDLAEIFPHLIENDEYRIASEQFPQGIATWRNLVFVGPADDFVSCLSGQLVSYFSPGSERTDAVTHRSTIRGVGVFTIERGNPDFCGRDDFRIYKFSHV